MTTINGRRVHSRPRSSATRRGRWLCRWLAVQLGAAAVSVPLAVLEWRLLARLLHDSHLAAVVLAVVVGAGTAAIGIPATWPAVVDRLGARRSTRWLLVCWRMHRHLVRALARGRAGRVLLHVTSAPRVRRARQRAPASLHTRIGARS